MEWHSPNLFESKTVRSHRSAEVDWSELGPVSTRGRGGAR